VVAVLLAALVAGCDSDAGGNDEQVGKPGKPVVLRFMVYGPPEEVAAYESIVSTFNGEHENVVVSLVTVSNAQQALAQLRQGDTPDIFLLSRRDLAEVADNDINQPLGDLLDARGIDFADLYKRDAIQAFSYEDDLQCMPYGVSPMVIYYNTSLIDFETMEEQELPTPSSPQFWTFEQFAAAADFASRRGTKGVYIEPSLLGLAPFIYSGGGDLFDDDHEPTTLALSTEDSRNALDRTLEVLRDERLTLTPKQVRAEKPLDRFKTGKLGMIAGFRNLVPELRRTPSLNFNVMPMPALDGAQTVGEVNGLCMAGSATSVGDAADFITHAISTESVAEVARAGYLVPSNNEVAESDSFLQPDQKPMDAFVFNRSVRDIVSPPLFESYPQLEETVHDLIYQMFYAQVLDLDDLTSQIDELSRPLIDPEEPEDEQSQ
jgi:multiple sugar transport system substrate-binding protein